jgi:hypothetical protein
MKIAHFCPLMMRFGRWGYGAGTSLEQATSNRKRMNKKKTGLALDGWRDVNLSSKNQLTVR